MKTAMGTSIKKQIDSTISQLRKSREYAEWVKMNRSIACEVCGSEDKLHCHHEFELFNVTNSVWKEYGDWDKVYRRLSELHETNNCGPSHTYCESCHQKRHPQKILSAKTATPEVAQTWSFMPRNHGFDFTHCTRKSDPKQLGLIDFQTFLALNWGILNGHMESRILVMTNQSICGLIGKKYGTSFKKSLKKSLEALRVNNCFIGYHYNNDKVEIIYSKENLQHLSENPWFIPMNDVKTSRMTALTLRVFLGFLSNRRTYAIGVDKLCGHLDIITKRHFIKELPKIIKDVPICKSVSIKNNIAHFLLRRKRVTPVHTLRRIIDDVLS